MNVEQFLYSMFVGIIFGMVVVRTGKVRYVIYMHMLTSLFGAVILPGVPMDSEVIIVIVLVLGGIVSAGIEIRKYYMQKARGSLTS